MITIVLLSAASSRCPVVVNSTAWLFGHRRSIYGTTLMANGAAARLPSRHDADRKPLSEERTLLSSLPYSSVLLACVDFGCCCYSLNQLDSASNRIYAI